MTQNTKYQIWLVVMALGAFACSVAGRLDDHLLRRLCGVRVHR